MKKDNILLPENHTATEFLRGKASRIFEEVVERIMLLLLTKTTNRRT